MHFVFIAEKETKNVFLKIIYHILFLNFVYIIPEKEFLSHERHTSLSEHKNDNTVSERENCFITQYKISFSVSKQ